MIHLKDVVKEGMRERFDEMRRMGIRTVMITGDNPLTARAIAEEAGVDDFLAEATPEDKMALIRREQEGGRLVAMTGDGTNDAPALAQADVGVAMNTGTSAAKEAGNMVDLDSNPTKLIEIVEIGKQLLITRGSLTTFSIANDIAKYFAIIPAMFGGVYAGLDKLNVMRLDSPESAILSAVIFNALIIIGADPAGAAGRAVQAVLRGIHAAPQPRHLRPRRDRQPVHRHQAHRSAHLADPRHQLDKADTMAAPTPQSVRQYGAAARSLLALTVILGLAYPLSMTGIAQVAFSDNADGSLVHRDGTRRRLRPDRPGVHAPGRGERQTEAGRRWQPGDRAGPEVLPEPSLGRRTGLRPPLHVGVQPRSREQGPHRRRQGASCGRGRARRSRRPRLCRQTRSSRADRASTRTSARPTRVSRSRGWPGSED